MLKHSENLSKQTTMGNFNGGCVFSCLEVPAYCLQVSLALIKKKNNSLAGKEPRKCLTSKVLQ